MVTADPYSSLLQYRMQGGFEGGNGDFQQWKDLEDKKKALDAQLAQASAPAGSLGGYKYNTTAGSLLPNNLASGYGEASGFIARGSQNADEELRKQYESMLRARSGGIGMAYGNAMQRTGSSLAGQGVSPMLSSTLMGGQRANMLGQMAQGMGGDEANYHSHLAQLMKGTGTELAGLKTQELGSTLNYLVGKAGADAAGKTDPLADLGGLLGGIGSLGSLFSDRRLKRDIVRMGSLRGVPVYEFSYIGMGGRFRGVMAQDVEHLGVTHRDASGYLKVNYAKLGIPFEQIG